MKKSHSRNIHRTLFFCISLSLALWRLPPMIEKLSERLNSGDGAASSLLAAMSTGAGVPGKNAKNNSKGALIVFPAKGRELTSDQRRKMIGAARNIAPLSYEQLATAATEDADDANSPQSTGSSKATEQNSQSAQGLKEQADKTLKESKKPD